MVVKEPGMGAALIGLDISKAFDRVDERYLEADLRAACFGPDFLGLIAVNGARVNQGKSVDLRFGICRSSPMSVTNVSVV